MEPGAKPFVDDLLLGRGFVRSRAAPSLRSIESQPSTQGFVSAGFPVARLLARDRVARPGVTGAVASAPARSPERPCGGWGGDRLLLRLPRTVRFSFPFRRSPWVWEPHAQ